MPPAQPRRSVAIVPPRARLLDTVVRGLLGYLHVVHVRFAHAGGGDLDEFGARAHRLDRRAAAIAHRGAHPAHELVYHGRERTLVRHAALDALGHELFGG